MPMNTVIQERRKLLGLTQEQLAQSLNVSAPAVSKWESGVTSPDLALLPALARLLKIDLNTLFCFHETLSPQEIDSLCRQVTGIIQTDGFAAGFDTAAEALREYPHDASLRLNLTLLLEGQLTMSPSEDPEAYAPQIRAWYTQLCQSEDPNIRDCAKFLLASRYIREDDLEKAQDILDSMPGREPLLSTMADKQLLQITIYQRQGKHDLAIQQLQQNLFLTAQKLQQLLNKLLDAELSAGNRSTAKLIAQKAGQLPGFLGLWEYCGYAALLQPALWEQDADTTISLLDKMLHAMVTPQNLSSGPLFYKLSGKTTARDMLPPILQEITQSPDYAFLRDIPAFENLVRTFSGP